MTERRNFRRTEPTDDRISDRVMDQAYGQRARGGVIVNWTAIGVIGSFLFSAVAVIAYGVNMNANINSNHAIETAQLTAQQAQITQLQTDEKETAKQNLEILLHLSSIDQTLKDKLTPSDQGGTRVYLPATAPPATGNTTIYTGPPVSAQPSHPAISPAN